MKRLLRAVGRPLVAVAALAPLLVLNTPAAVAAPVIGDIWCESGARKFYCFADVSGTVGTVDGRWDLYLYNNYIGSLQGDTFTGVRSCSARLSYRIEYYVTDDTGTAHASTSVYCNPDSWP